MLNMCLCCIQAATATKEIFICVLVALFENYDTHAIEMTLNYSIKYRDFTTKANSRTHTHTNNELGGVRAIAAENMKLTV